LFRLEGTSHHIAAWPEPTVGKSFDLGLLGHVFSQTIPGFVLQVQHILPAPYSSMDKSSMVSDDDGDAGDDGEDVAHEVVYNVV
jgi:hypothetical protein